MSPEAFIERWAASRGHEDQVDRQFFLELCDLLGVARPDPAAEARASFCFQKGVKIVHGDGTETTRRIDFYKRDCFVIEAKQGSDAGDHDVGTARRGTERWRQAMRAAFAQAHEYAINLPEGRPPFLVTCDIGHVFEVWTGFSGSYGGYGASRRIPFGDLARPEVRDFFRAVFEDPQSLDPARYAARVTREVAEHLANLARDLEPAHGAERTAAFLMRCIFTMFAEDVGLLDGDLFKDAIRNHWIPDPAAFPAGVAALWTAMDQGTQFGFKRLLRFNGGLFASTEALPLTRPQLQELLAAAERDWSAVEPTIFGTLVERALSDEDRARLGAHFTPREYIERLVRPTILDPLRLDWTLALAQARQIMAAASLDPSGAPREPSAADRLAAAAVLRGFHTELCRLRVLDPACGSGNFLYVSFALLKDLEDEVNQEIADLGEASLRLELESVSVNPSQFLGIELNPRAREIADLVLWIGYLQWHRRARGGLRPVEPVLRSYKNIACGDAVLTYTDRTLRRDPDGRPLTVWNMRTYAISPVTGELVPSNDPQAQVPLYDYTDPAAADWPEADFIVSNPPFCGNKPMRKALGDGYTEALRAAYPQVPQTSDLVVYWWEKAAALVRAGAVRRFGLITTNSITQKFNRGVVQAHLGAKKEPLALAFAIADHPWVLAGAAVRIAMTVGVRASELAQQPVLGEVVAERRPEGGDSGARQVEVATRSVAVVHADLTGGANVVGATRLRANQGMSYQGMNLVGEGFRLDATELAAAGYTPRALPPVVRPYLNARDMTQGGEERWVIDLYGLTADQGRDRYPQLYQRVLDRVKPERDHNKRDSRRKNWWLFGEPVGRLRSALTGLDRYIVTPETSKHRIFTFVPRELLPDHKLFAITRDDALLLGVLSSRFHESWSLAAGGWMGVGNDPCWRNTTCFEPFPFPTATPTQAARIRQLAERLDAHRKSVLTSGFLAVPAPTAALMVAEGDAGPKVTLTALYNALARLREASVGGPPLTYTERAFHDRALVGVLRSLHGELDAAVADAYGWPVDLPDEALLARLVALNAERAQEEGAGVMRWLRPSLQDPSGTGARPAALGLALEPTQDAESDEPRPEWPKSVQGQLKALRDLLVARGGAWTADAAARSFHNARAPLVARHLGALADLGVLASYGAGPERRWSAAARP